MLFILTLILVLIISTHLMPSGAQASQPTTPYILILSAYHPGYQWSDAVLSGIRDTITASRPNARLFVEYLDSKRRYSQAALDRLADLIRVKYDGVRLDALIVCDDNSLAFLHKHRATLFGGIPTVFCGANDVDPQRLAALAPITGVNEAADVRASLEAALALLPDTEEVVVVNDATPTGRNVHAEIQRAAAGYADRVRFTYVEALPFEAILDRLADLEAGTIVLYSFFFRDSQGHFYEYDESARAVSAASKVPVFGLWEFNLGHGIVGGKLVSGYTQGSTAGKLTLRALNGEDPADIPIVMHSPNRFAFDHEQISRFSLDPRRLPAGSHIINRPRSLYEENRPLIWSVATALVALFLLSGCLLVAIRRGRSSARQLRASQSFLAGITSNIPGVVFQFCAREDGQWGLTYLSDKTMEILGLEPDPDRFLDAVIDNIHPADRSALLTSIQAAVDAEEPWHFEGRYQKPSGEGVWLTGDSVPHREGARLLFDGVILDVTDRKHRLTNQRQRLDRFQRQQAALIAMGNHGATIDGDMESAARFLTEAMASALDVGRVGVWMLDGESGDLVLTDGYDVGQGAHSKGARLEAAHCPRYLKAQREDQVIAADDALNDPRTAELATDYLTPAGIGALLDAAILVAGRLVGVICQEHVGTPRAWHGDEISLARSAAEFLARTLLQAEHLKAQADLKASERLQAQIINFLPDPTFVINNQGKVIVWNRAIAEITGIPEQEMLGKGDFAYAVPFYGRPRPVLIDLVLRWDSAMADDYIQIKRDGDIIYSENWNQLVAGDRRYFRNSARPLLDDGGQVIGAIEITRDVTEAKQAEAELRKRQDFLESVLYHAPDAIIILDDSHHVVEWNPGAEKMFGYSQSEAMGKELDRLVSQGDARREANLKTANLLGGERVDAFETLRYRKDGTAVPVIAAGSPIMADGKLTGVVAMYTDVSDLKKAEAEIRQRERMLRLVLDTIPVRVFWKDRDCRYLGCNRPFAQDSGHEDPNEVIGLDDFAFSWAADQAELYRSDDKAVMQSGEARLDYEETQTTPAGDQIWLQTSKVPIRNRHDEVIGVLGTYQDITERKAAEEEVRRLRNYLANIIDSMPSVLVGVDAQGRVTQWNTEAEKLTGQTYAQVKDQPLAAVIPHFNTEMARIQRAIRDREVVHDPKVPRHRDGETRYQDVTIYPLVAKGVEGAVIRMDDVTERVRLEEMMIQSEKMLSVGGLAAGMAHEINNPLAGILQNATVLENRLSKDMPANRAAARAAGIHLEALQAYLEERKLPEMIAAIRSSGERAAAIVRNMLSFARKGDRDMRHQDMGALLDKTIELVQTDYDMKKRYDFRRIKIVRDYAPGVPSIPCEASKIQQVFLNILKNGAEAMAAAPGTARPPRFTLRVRQETQWIRVEIEDNGPGMPEAVCKRIFEPFFTTKPVGRGTGLGLSVSYFIISEDHGGKMTVSSKPGQGSCFKIRLRKHRKLEG